MKNLFTIMLFVAALAMTAQAQTVTTTVPPTPPVKPGEAKIAAELIAASSMKVVKGAPYSTEAVSESVQILADGNKITRSSTTKMYRDGEGRTRREGAGGGGFVTGMGIGSGGGAVGGGNVAVTPMPSGNFTMFYGFDQISIFDPVAGMRYSLNPSNKTARSFNVKDTLISGGVYVSGQMTMPSVKSQIETSVGGVGTTVATTVTPKAQAITVMPGMYSYSTDAGKTESLGTKTFEGVEAEGTRTVTTIEAGKIGNERPIEIVYERWFSKELDLTVYSRHYDPRFGEQIYRLTNIDRSEPDRSLFTVPSDYKITAEPQMKVYTTTTPSTPKAQQ
ncbi:MAG: hypothetical protein WA584_22055 [Pyrinomonadaceae bacterium]